MTSGSAMRSASHVESGVCSGGERGVTLNPGAGCEGASERSAEVMVGAHPAAPDRTVVGAFAARGETTFAHAVVVTRGALLLEHF